MILNKEESHFAESKYTIPNKEKIVYAEMKEVLLNKHFLGFAGRKEMIYDKLDFEERKEELLSKEEVDIARGRM